MSPTDRVTALLADAFDPDRRPELGATTAALVTVGDELVLERYGAGIDPAATQPSWSMAKSVLAALVGIAHGDGTVDLDEPIGWPGWSGDDPRAAITARHLLRMAPGLDWVEDYVATPTTPEASGRSAPTANVVDMLYGRGRSDVAAYAASAPLAHPPGTRFLYSSGTSNLLAWWLGRHLGPGPDGIGAFAHRRLFEPCGMASPVLKYDDAGTWIGSTYCFATPADLLRFGRLHLAGGRWNGADVLPTGWVAACTEPHPAPGEEPWGYGLHWWTRPELGGVFAARGYRAQLLLVAPALDLVLLRLGVTEHEHGHHVHTWALELAAALGG